jgi:glycosyltransferase involved in cell wall biosynthesis
MRVLVLSSVFPNVKQPTLGVFIRERIRRVAGSCEVVVLAPVPWFPLNRVVRGARWVGIPSRESQDGMEVLHPRVFSVPGILKCLDGIFYAVSLAAYIYRLRRRFAFDVIDAHFAYPDGLGAVLLGRLFRRPVIITLRGSIVRLAGYPLHRPQLRYALRAATRVLSVSNSLKAVAVALGAPGEKIRVVPNGVDVERFRPLDRGKARATLHLPEDRTVLLSVGGLNEGKGHHRVVAVLPRLLKERPDLLYVIVGSERPSDTVRPLLNRLIAQAGLGDHVRIVGERPHDEIPLWLAAADVFCLATRSEGWANVLLEASACGRPVVATRVGGNAEVVSSAGLGILVPPGDDTALADAIAEALRRRWDPAVMVEHARRHSWATAVGAVLDELRGVAGAADPRPAGTKPSGALRGTR